MPKIESLRQYPVAGMDGFEVSKLIFTPEAILGDRTFCLVLETELQKHADDNTYTPLRMTQTRFPELTLFKTSESGGKLTISIAGDSITVDQSIFAEYVLPNTKVLPIRASKSSAPNSKRLAVDCGETVAKWLSEKLSHQIRENNPLAPPVKVRLVKAIQHPESKKQHFTWYTDVHAVARTSLEQLALDAGKPVDEFTFRFNMLLSETGDAYDEESWTNAVHGSFEIVVTNCIRCGYIGIDRATGIFAQHIEAMTTIMKDHNKKFGVYLKPPLAGEITFKVGDELSFAV